MKTLDQVLNEKEISLEQRKTENFNRNLELIKKYLKKTILVEFKHEGTIQSIALCEFSDNQKCILIAKNSVEKYWMMVELFDKTFTIIDTVSNK